MKKILLGSTNELISCIGLGTMYFGTKIDEDTSFSILNYYTELGGTFLDTANKYASWVPDFKGGESEFLIGKWIKQKANRQNMFISSKVGFPYGDIPRSLKKEIIISECEKSLKRLNIETLDLYFAHAWDMETPVEETMEAFHQLKKSGKIRFAGASNFYAWQLFEANSAAGIEDWEGFTCIQQRHTYLEPSMRANFGVQKALTPELHEFCIQKNIRIIAYSPLLGGAYSKNDYQIPDQYQNKFTETKLIRLNKVAEEFMVSANAVVLAWMMQSSPGIIPLVTGSSVAQLKENMMALLVRLSDKHLKLLNENLAQPLKY
jgi:aryl-alcohol dehydrogenase-like predicted oxidoreductase